MDVTKFKIPEHWPADAQRFARDAISEVQGRRADVKTLVADVLSLRGTLAKAQEEMCELKSKLGTNSSNSHQPPSKDPPGTHPREVKGTGRRQGAQKGHPGAGRSLFSPDRVQITRDVFPCVCPISGVELRRENLVSLSHKPVHQIDLPKDIAVTVTEWRLHTCLCTCGCGKTLSAKMPTEAGNSVVGHRLKALMALLATRYRLSKTLIQELLIDVFGPDATLSTGCISESEAEMTAALEKPYEEAREAIQRELAAHVDETSWFLKHKIHWLWVAVSNALSVFFIDPNRSRAAFERFLGDFEGFIISDRFSAYSHLSPEDRQLCWAHLIRDFQKLVDRNGGAEGIGKWALEEIERMFSIWHLYLDGKMDRFHLRQEFVTIRARFGRLLKLGQETRDSRAAKLCKNLTNLWPSLWNFLLRPDILQPTNNEAERGVRSPVMMRMLSLGSQSGRGLRFIERMLTMIASLRRQGRRILDFLQEALLSHRGAGPMPSLVAQPSG